jgi:hypothetical protein
MSDNRRWSIERIGGFCGALFLLGLALLFQYDRIWPGILPLIWITAAPLVMSELGWQCGLWVLVQMAFWTAGLPLLFRFDRVWPGILTLVGLSALLAAIAPPGQLAARRGETDTVNTIKRKRGLPLPSLEQGDILYGGTDAVDAGDPEAVPSDLSGHRPSAQRR